MCERACVCVRARLCERACVCGVCVCVVCEYVRTCVRACVRHDVTALSYAVVRAYHVSLHPLLSRLTWPKKFASSHCLNRRCLEATGASEDNKRHAPIRTSGAHNGSNYRSARNKHVYENARLCHGAHAGSIA